MPYTSDELLEKYKDSIKPVEKDVISALVAANFTVRVHISNGAVRVIDSNKYEGEEPGLSVSFNQEDSTFPRHERRHR